MRISIGELFENLEYGPAPEAADAANAWLDDHDREFGNFINNKVRVSLNLGSSGSASFVLRFCLSVCLSVYLSNSTVVGEARGTAVLRDPQPLDG
jgi:hypothetical protein